MYVIYKAHILTYKTYIHTHIVFAGIRAHTLSSSLSYVCDLQGTHSRIQDVHTYTYSLCWNSRAHCLVCVYMYVIYRAHILTYKTYLHAHIPFAGIRARIV